MHACLDRLPRTLVLLRAGEPSISGAEDAATEAVAAFASTAAIERGCPIACCLDQRALPDAESYLCTTEWRDVVHGVKELAVRGAPAIGASGACALVLAVHEAQAAGDEGAFLRYVEDAACAIRDARPTAVNLSWAVDRVLVTVKDCVSAGDDPSDASVRAFDEAHAIMAEDEAANRAIGRHGCALLPDSCSVLTHCNAGSLATSFYGTALGIIYAAADAGKVKMVYADETRPVCQGSRLTVWELARAGVPVTLICDDMAASVMASGKVDAVIVGADRIAANGDVANKIGTLAVAILADRYQIPFYVAAPLSTVDAGCLCGDAIVIEERAASEVLPKPIEGVAVFNPAFDVTPACLVRAIITECGVFAPEDIASALRLGACDNG